MVGGERNKQGVGGMRLGRRDEVEEVVRYKQERGIREGRGVGVKGHVGRHVRTRNRHYSKKRVLSVWRYGVGGA